MPLKHNSRPTQSRVIRFIMWWWWWCMVPYKNTALGQLIGFLMQMLILSTAIMCAQLSRCKHNNNTNATYTTTTHKFVQIMKYSSKRFIHSSGTSAFHCSSSNVTYDQSIRSKTSALHGHAHQFPAIDTHIGSETFSSIRKVRPAPVHRVETKTPQLAIILMNTDE